MNSLPLFQIESGLLDTMEVASNYGIGKRAITQHFSRNQDELIEGVHYHLETSPQFKTKVIKWTLEGVYMLGFFVKKSKVAKEYRSKVAKAIAQAREKQLAEAKETKARNVELAHKYADLEAYAKFEVKRQADQINGYKSQLAKHNAVIASLKNELAEFKPKNGEPRYETLKTLLEHARKERDFYRKKSIKLENEKRDKELRTFRALQQTKEQLEHVYTAIGAVEAYVANDDRFFMEQNEILKG